MKKYTEIGLLIAAGLIISFVIYKVIDALNIFEGKAAPVKLYGDNALDANGNPTTQGANDLIDFDPKPYTNALHEAIYSVSGAFGFGIDEAYQNPMQLSNDELILVYNDWLDRFYHDDSETLTTAIENETFSFFSTAGQFADALVNRLHSLNCN